MQTRITSDRQPSAEEKSLRDPPQVQRERKLWSFLTWSFLLAQIAIVDKLLGPSAHAALDEEALPGSDESADGQDAATGNIADVATFTGENAQEGAAETHGEAGRFELSGKQPDVTLPDIENAAGGGAPGLHALVAGNDSDMTASDMHATDSVLTDNPDTNGAEFSDPEAGPADVASLNLDTSIVSDLLDQLDLDALGLVGDVGELALSTVNGLVAPVFKAPLVSSLTDTLEGLQSDFMIALTSGGDQPVIPAALQSFTQSLPVLETLHQDADDDDLIQIVVDDEAIDTITSLIDSQLLDKSGLIG